LTGRRVASVPEAQVSGDGVNRCLQWTSDAGPLFVKLAPAERLWVFEAEAEGLAALAAASAIRVPEVQATGIAGREAFLAIEWLDLCSPTASSEAVLGAELARQHRSTAARHGWHRDNTIGPTIQRNDFEAEWAQFYADRRLRVQLDLAEAGGHGGRWIERGRRVVDCVPALLAGHVPVPSLLHGDLWAGNHAADTTGRPVVFDPSVHYGDRETDLEMTRLFGGYGREFYAAYESAWPLDTGAAARAPLYDLYHVLNHLNLFGGGYRRQAEELIERLLASVRG